MIEARSVNVKKIQKPHALPSLQTEDGACEHPQLRSQGSVSVHAHRTEGVTESGGRDGRTGSGARSESGAGTETGTGSGQGIETGTGTVMGTGTKRERETGGGRTKERKMGTGTGAWTGRD